MTNILNWAQVEFSKEPIELVAKYGPFLTPIMPASMAVVGMATTGRQTLMGDFAFVPALASGLGMEGTGYLASHLLIRAIKRKDLLSGLLSLVFLVAYAAFAIHAMQNIQNAGMFQAFVAMSVITYLGAGLYTYNEYADKARDIERERQAKEHAEKLRYQQEQIELKRQWEEIEHAKRQQELELQALKVQEARAQARRIKAEHEQLRSVVRQNKPNNRTAEQNAKLEAVRQAMAELQAAGEKITTRAVAAKTGMSNSTASGYMAEIGVQK